MNNDHTRVRVTRGGGILNALLGIGQKSSSEVALFLMLVHVIITVLKCNFHHSFNGIVIQNQATFNHYNRKMCSNHQKISRFFCH